MKIFKFTFFLLLVLSPIISHGADLDFVIHTGAESVNAVEGTILLPQGLNSVDISYGDSVIVIWIKQPTLEGSKITFSGMTPGGFKNRGNVFTIKNVSDEEANQIRIESVTVLKNDGQGSTANANFSFIPRAVNEEDKISPQKFSIALSKSKDLFGNHTFAVFLSQDKESGIDHYEVAETYFFKPASNDWKISNSPYEVKDRFGIKKLYVKAVDKAGNMTLEKIPLDHRKFAWIFVIIVAVICVLFVRYT